MAPAVLLGLAIGLPAVLIVLLRSDAAIVLLAVPLMPYGTQSQFIDNFLWDRLNQYQAAIIGASIAIALVSMWMSAHGGLKLRKKHH